ncbi:glucosyl-3-phosphoglycerate synthase [Corynebacterium uropygiale]|uniref:Glucosyl-3-phosphoglycerate synthase n=1 Tax=Corynebacterium uropygiale TaxID=1775911 RepID=A0A9X1QPR8_9CORY|nr:glucosyl-3-phosphoglycerate synthase [Corynebacterium uropygiale]MCF4006896.1 glucosyl-3-phosphoglycerate synthase [Corynebacterium uropygiale]
MSAPGTVSVVIPALNEEATVADVVRAVAADAPTEILVIDADSTDHTAERAREAGATVLNWRSILPGIPPRPGKGESLWRGVAAARGEAIVFVDADLENPQPDMVSRLAAPLADPCVHLVKASYTRMFEGQPSGGGRVTELCAKPIMALLYPELSHIPQPLAGEYAVRRSVARRVPFVEGYGVEAGLLVDVARRWGPGAIRSVELGPRAHRNRPLEELSPMAEIVAATLIDRQSVSERPPLSEIQGDSPC